MGTHEEQYLKVGTVPPGFEFTEVADTRDVRRDGEYVGEVCPDGTFRDTSGNWVYIGDVMHDHGRTVARIADCCNASAGAMRLLAQALDPSWTFARAAKEKAND